LPSAVRLGLIGYYLSTFLPGAVGGDIIRAACIARQQNRRTVAVATVILDRVIGFCGLFWLVALLGGIFWAGGWLDAVAVRTGAAGVLQAIILGAAGLAGASLVFWLLLGVLPAARAERFASWLERIPRVGPSLGELWRAVWMYRCRGRSVALALVMAVVGHVGFVLAFYFASLTLTPAAEVPTLGAHYLLVPVGMTIQAGFPTPGGVGAAEYGYGKLYEKAGFAESAGVLASLVQRALNWILSLTGYLVYLRMRPDLHAPAPEPVGSVPLSARGCPG
jgi:hypothetical protein